MLLGRCRNAQAELVARLESEEPGLKTLSLV
jgi:hypothetical protein